MIELAAVIAIIAVLMGSAISAGMRGNESAKISTTQSKLYKVEEALVAFLKVNKRLPCPAQASLASSNASYGAEDCTNTAQSACGGGDCDANLRVGIVPAATLGLPPEMMLDAWDRRITYAVSLPFTDKTKLVGASGVIKVLGYADTVTKTTTGAYALLTHGKNGHGAWPKEGGTTRVNAGVSSGAEVQHGDTIASEKSFDKTFRQALPVSDFDDMLIFRTATQMYWAAGAATINETCEFAKRTLCPVDGSVTPKRGPVGCDVEGASSSCDSTHTGTTYCDQECLDRQTVLARAIFDSGICFGSDADFSDCR